MTSISFARPGLAVDYHGDLAGEVRDQSVAEPLSHGHFESFPIGRGARVGELTAAVGNEVGPTRDLVGRQRGRRRGRGFGIPGRTGLGRGWAWHARSWVVR